MGIEQPDLPNEVKPVLDLLLVSVVETLGDHLVGLYLHGSLALGAFNPRRSDIDFLTAVSEDLADDQVAALGAMHRRIAASGLAWANHIEGSYIPLQALRRYDPANACHPALSVEGHFRVEQHGPDWNIQRSILREHGLTLYGPPIRGLIDPVSPDALRSAQVGTLRDWWAPMLVNQPEFLATVEYQAYAVLTMCRARYTYAHGRIVSKPEAARWAVDTLDPHWRPLIERALAWPDGPQPDNLPETLEFIRATLAQIAV